VQYHANPVPKEVHRFIGVPTTRNGYVILHALVQNLLDAMEHAYTHAPTVITDQQVLGPSGEFVQRYGPGRPFMVTDIISVPVLCTIESRPTLTTVVIRVVSSLRSHESDNLPLASGERMFLCAIQKSAPSESFMNDHRMSHDSHSFIKATENIDGYLATVDFTSRNAQVLLAIPEHYLALGDIVASKAFVTIGALEVYARPSDDQLSMV